MTIPAQRRPPLPMQLCSADRSLLLADPAAWAWTVKYDGFRCQVGVAHRALWSRQGNSLCAGFGDAQAAVTAALGQRDVVLDCELVTLDAQARPDFAALSARAGCRGAAAERAAAATPAVLVAFDILVADGVDVRGRGWQQRRVLVEQLELPQTLNTGAPALVCAPVYEDGAALLEVTRLHRLEGVVAAHRRQPYRAGRGQGYVKVKHPEWARDLQGDGRAWRRRTA